MLAALFGCPLPSFRKPFSLRFAAVCLAIGAMHSAPGYAQGASLPPAAAVVVPAPDTTPVLTLPQMYGYAFRAQLGIERLERQRRKNGKSTSGMDSYMSRRLGLTVEEFAPFLAAAEAYEAEAKIAQDKLKASVKKIRDARAKKDREALRAILQPIGDRAEQMNQGQMDAIHAALSPELATKLDRGVEAFYRAATASNDKINASQTTRMAQSVAAPLFEGPNCTCGYATSIYQTMVFTADGSSVYAYVEGYETYNDWMNGCSLSADTSLVDQGNVVDEDPWGEVFWNYVVGYVSGSVTVGDLYSYSSLLQECGLEGPCNSTFVSGYSFQTGRPQITGSTMQSTVLQGASGQFTLTGNDLGGPPEGLFATTSSTNSGVTLPINQLASYSAASTPGEASTQQVSYQVNGSTTPGSYSYTLSTVWGQSDAQNFTVGCATPSVQSVTPSPWNAGAKLRHRHQRNRVLFRDPAAVDLRSQRLRHADLVPGLRCADDLRHGNAGWHRPARDGHLDRQHTAGAGLRHRADQWRGSWRHLFRRPLPDAGLPAESLLAQHLAERGPVLVQQLLHYCGGTYPGRRGYRRRSGPRAVCEYGNPLGRLDLWDHACQLRPQLPQRCAFCIVHQLDAATCAVRQLLLCDRVDAGAERYVLRDRPAWERADSLGDRHRQRELGSPV